MTPSEIMHGRLHLRNVLFAKVGHEDDITAKVKMVDCGWDLKHTEQYVHLESVS